MNFSFKPKDCQDSPWTGSLGTILKDGVYFCEISNGSSIEQAALNRDILTASLNRYAFEESREGGPFVISRVDPNNPKFRQFFRIFLWVFPVWAERADAKQFKTKAAAMKFADEALYGTVNWADITSAKEPRLP